jgi:hypothetical protein
VPGPKGTESRVRRAQRALPEATGARREPRNGGGVPAPPLLVPSSRSHPAAALEGGGGAGV